MAMKNVFVKSIQLFAGCLIGNFGFAVAQSLPTVIPGTPEAMDLAKYINYPVDYSTGIPDITIPLYEIKMNGFTLPISISYHASGLKANQLSGCVGYGWTLNAEPLISRSIKGNPDEELYGYFGTDFDKLRALPGNTIQDIQAYKNEYAEGRADGEPDEFYFKLANKSGKFYFTRPNYGTIRKIVTYPFMPVKIEQVQPPQPPTNFNQFKITDNDGTVYYFGPTIDHSGMHGERSSWKASKIITANNEEINFTYHSSDFFIQRVNQDRVEVEDSFSNQYMQPPMHKGENYSPSEHFFANFLRESPSVKSYYKDANYYSVVAGGSNVLYGFATLEVDQLVSQYPNISSSTPDEHHKVATGVSMIHEISFPNGKIVFEKSDAHLTAVKIYGDGKLIKQFVFNASAPSGSDNNAYTLDYIQMTASNNTPLGTYRFGYHSGNIAAPSVTARGDYWGFFNGLYTGPHYGPRVPSQTVTTTRQYYSDADTGHVYFDIGNYNPVAPDSNLIKSHVLDSIVYPTGGYTTFKYELNKYKHHGVIYDGGGLRVKQIAHYERLGASPIIKTYKYGENEDGAGTTKRPVDLADYMTEQWHLYYHFPVYDCNISGCGWVSFANSNPVQSRIRTYYSSPLVDPFYSDGAPVRYGKVTEYLGDGNNFSGKNEYTYNVDTIAYTQIVKWPGTSFYLDPKKDWMNNELVAERNYKYENGQFILQKERLLDYSIRTNIDTVSTFKQFKTKVIHDFDGGGWYGEGQVGYPEYLFNAYPLKSGVKLLEREQVTNYENDRSFTTTHIYRYNNANQITYSALINSAQDSVITTCKYPSEYGSQYSFMKKNDLWLDKAIEEKQYRNNAYIQTVKTHYALWNDSLIAPESVSLKQGNKPLKVRLRYYGYTSNGNILSVSRENGTKSSYLWGYNQQYPIAEVKNAEQPDIAYAGFESPDETSWTYAGATAIDITAPAGKYIYNLAGGNISKYNISTTKKYVLTYWAKSASASNISGGAATVITTRNGWTLYQRSITNQSNIILNGSVYVDDVCLYPEGAHMTTYTYDPLVGMSSSTDAGGHTIYYEYDDFGRLDGIKNQDKKPVQEYKYHYQNAFF